MRLTEQEIELIDAFLLGDLEGDALQNFEQRLKDDTEFAEEVERMRVVQMAAKQSSLEDKMKMLQMEEEKMSGVSSDSDRDGSRASEEVEVVNESAIEEKRVDKAKVIGFPWRRVIGIAASVLVVATVGFWWTTQSGEQPVLVDTSNFPDPPVELFMSNEKPTDSPKMIKASNLYNLAIHEKDAKLQHKYFGEAADLFEEVWEEERDSVALELSLIHI